MKVTWMSYLVLLQSEAWGNVPKIVAGHELQVQASDSNNNMTSLYTGEPCTWLMWSCKSETRSHTWAAQEKKKQTNKGMRVWGDGGGGGGGSVKNRKVLTSSGSTPKSLQSFLTPRIRASGVRLILAFVQAKFNLKLLLHNCAETNITKLQSKL